MLFNWQIKDPNEMMGGPSAWCFLNDSNFSNRTVLIQRNENFQSKSFLFGSQLLNKLRTHFSNYAYSLKFLIRSPTVFSLIFDYFSVGNFDQLLFSKSSQNSELSYQKIRNGQFSQKTNNRICQKSENLNEGDCFSLDFNEWHEIYLLSYENEFILKINDETIANYKRDSEFTGDEIFSFGVSSFTEGNKVLFTDFQYSMINFPKQAKDSIFGKMRNKFEENVQTRKNFEKQNFIGFRFQENPSLNSKNMIKVDDYHDKNNDDYIKFRENREKNSINFREIEFISRNDDKNSIESIKLACLKYQGSESSCTQAMIAYDELLSKTKREDIEEEEISRVVYKKCLDFEGNSPLGCSFAYKKALEVNYNLLNKC